MALTTDTTDAEFSLELTPVHRHRVVMTVVLELPYVSDLEAAKRVADQALCIDAWDGSITFQHVQSITNLTTGETASYPADTNEEGLLTPAPPTIFTEGRAWARRALGSRVRKDNAQ
jgi:hypothetical protein